MQDTALYEGVLGLTPPWFVEKVSLLPAESRVEVHVGTKSHAWECPVCGGPASRHDAVPRHWRHLDTCQFQTILVAMVPRVRCGQHGVKQVPVPWADRGSRFTALFELSVLRWLKVTHISAVTKLFGLSWSATDGILQRAVRRGLKRREAKLPRRLGIDETSFRKGHQYVTVICDQDTGHVVHVEDGRTAETVKGYLSGFEPEQREAVSTVAMDMWQAYITAVTELVPGAESKICFDKFHLAQHLSKAVDQVRRRETKTLAGAGDDSLKGTRYLWLKQQAHRSDEDEQSLQELLRVALKTSRAWAIKEAGMTIWRYRSRHWARKALLKWYDWAIRSRLEPIKRVARMVKRHLEGLVNAMHHGITNARSESINSRIQWIKSTAKGFRNNERFQWAILFHLGGLDVTPAALKPIHFHTT